MSVLKFSFVLFLSLAVFSPQARAQAQWFDGGFEFEPGLACITWNPETTVSSYAGYWGTGDVSFPRTGDVSYVRGVAAVVGNPCAGGDVINFNFQLPAGTTLAVSAQTPVVCMSTRLSDGLVVTEDANIHCSQTAMAGTHGGLDFGYAVVPRGWMFEIRVPVQFNRELLGMAGPSADKLKVGVITTNDYRVPEAWVTAPYRALVNYPSPSAQHQSSGTNVYRVNTNVYNFYKAGLVEFEVGSSSGIYDDGVVYFYSLPNTASSFQVWSDLEFGGYTSDVYWRARFTPSGGATYYGPEQHFVANGGNPSSYALTVSKAGAGSGTVTSNPVGLSCGATCSQNYTSGTLVTLSAAVDPGSTFTGWSGACSGTGTCSVTMSAARSVTATFGVAAVATYGSLDVSVEGLPAGSVGSIAVTGPSGYSHTFNILTGTGQSLSDVTPGEYVGVAADVVAGSTYVPSPRTLSTGIVGGGRGSIVANYVLGRQLTISKAGSGVGSVVTSPGGIDCGTSCSSYFASGTVVTLTAAPGIGAAFAGWSGGGCSGTGTCDITLSSDQAVTASFDPAAAGTFPLVITTTGTGFGTVTSNPVGIDCGAVCNFNYADGTQVILTATPSTGSEFGGWSGGGCSGTGTCNVTVDALTEVSADFNLPGESDPTTPPRRSSSDDEGCNQTGSAVGGLVAAAALLLRRRRPKHS